MASIKRLFIFHVFNRFVDGYERGIHKTIWLTLLTNLKVDNHQNGKELLCMQLLGYNPEQITERGPEGE